VLARTKNWLEKWKSFCYLSVREQGFSLRESCAEQGEVCASNLYWKKEARAREWA
jgi:hypothetical protein